jgi:hypothetical protein
MAVANALGQRGSKCVTAAPWKSPLMAWSTVWDDYFRVAIRPEPIFRFPIADAVEADQFKFMRRRRDSKRGWSRRLRKRNEPLMP